MLSRKSGYHGVIRLRHDQVCTKCKIEKDSSQFHRNTLTASGLVARCKQCIAEADAKRCGLAHHSHPHPCRKSFIVVL